MLKFHAILSMNLGPHGHGYSFSVHSDMIDGKRLQVWATDSSDLYEQINGLYKSDIRPLLVQLLDETPARGRKALHNALGDLWTRKYLRTPGSYKGTFSDYDIASELQDADDEYYMDAFWRIMDSFVRLSVHFSKEG